MLTLGIAMAHIARVMGDQVHAATEQERNASLPAGFGLFLFAFLALDGYACWRSWALPTISTARWRRPQQSPQARLQALVNAWR